MDGTLIEQLDKALGLGLDATEWERTRLARGLEVDDDGQPTILRDKRIIKGFAVVTKGPVLGHNTEADDVFLEQVMTSGNKNKSGMKMRFDHPNASSTSMGKAIGRARNFRRDGDVVRADAHLLETGRHAPDGDLVGYVMDLAQESPESFGASIVFERGDTEFEKDEDGNTNRDKPGKARLKTLHGVDVVDDPAANPSGIFGREASLASKISDFLDRWAEHNLVPAILARLGQAETSQHEKEKPMDELNVALPTEREAELRSEGATAERARVKAVHELGAKYKAEPAVLEELIELGASPEEAEKTLRLRRLGKLSAEAPASAGGPEDQTTQHVDFSALPLEERCKTEWDRNASLRAEFGQIETYTAFKRAEEAGRVKIYTGKAERDETS